MCRTLAAFPTSCLERAKEFKTRLGIFLHKSELGSDTGSVGKFEWGSKHSKEGKNFSEDVLGWKESFDLLLSSKSELCLLCLSVGGTRVAHGYPCAAEPA